MSDYALENKSYEMNSAITKTSHAKSAKKVLLLCAFVLIFLLLFTIVFYYYVFLPNTALAKIYFRGNTVLSEVLLKNKANISDSMHWNKIDSVEVAKMIANISSVESVSVQKKLPDKVFITITERVPVAICYVEADECTLPVFIDTNGVLFTCDEMPCRDLTIISGLEFKNFSVGMKLHMELRTLLKNIAVLQTENAELLRQISEIKILPKQYGGYELLLFPLGSKTRVRIKDTFDAETLKHVLLALDIVKGIQDFTQVREIDLRSGIAVIEKDKTL